MKNDPIEPIEELTDTMHATFTISEEKDREFRVWSAIEMQEQTGWLIEDTLRMQQVSWEDYEKYKDTQPSRRKD